MATGDGHTTAGSCFDSSVSPLRFLLCASTSRPFLSRCGRLSSSCSLRSSWGDGERTSKAITSRYTMGSHPPTRRHHTSGDIGGLLGHALVAYSPPASSVHAGCERSECRGRGDAPTAARGRRRRRIDMS